MEQTHVCPWWVGYFLASPIRKLRQDPVEILSPYVKKGMTVLDVGCGMGFFSLPMAAMVGNSGHVHCVDLQQKMLSSLQKRAKKAGVTERITAHRCTKESLCIDNVTGNIDFVLAFALVHEVPDKNRLFREFAAVMKKGGIMLLAEPQRRVSMEKVDGYISVAEKVGLQCVGRPDVPFSNSLLFKKK